MRVLLGKQVGSHDVTRDDPDLQVLVDRGDSTEVIETDKKTDRDENEGELAKPFGRPGHVAITHGHHESEDHRRQSARLDRGCYPVTPPDEDHDPGNEADHVADPGPSTPFLWVVLFEASSFSSREKNLAQEVEDPSHKLHEGVHVGLLGGGRSRDFTQSVTRKNKGRRWFCQSIQNQKNETISQDLVFL